MPDNEDDGRKAEPIATAVDRTITEIIRKNVERRVIKKPVIHDPANGRTQAEIVAGVRKPDWSYMEKQQAEDRTKRTAMVPVTLRIATELPFPAAMFRYNGIAFVSVDMKAWRATTNYDRLAARLTASNMPDALPLSTLMATFKSLTSPTVVPQNVTIVRPPNFSLPAPKKDPT